jgi:hypothetical protein
MSNRKITHSGLTPHSLMPAQQPTYGTTTVGSRFTMGLLPRIFGCKSNRHKTITI